MVRLPRIALGTVQPDAATQPMAWALAEAFHRIGVQTQSFYCRAHFVPGGAPAGAGGLSPRYLDSWLMAPDACRALFAYGARSADLAVVEGTFGAASEDAVGGQLGPLCEWLDLPRVVVLDSSRLQECCLPEMPADVAGILLDGVRDVRHFADLATNCESIFRAPVLGGLETTPSLGTAIADARRGQSIPAGLLKQLGDHFSCWWRPDAILGLASRREIFAADFGWLRAARGRRRKLTVALAFDEAFHCYFPDTLDLLELRGASVVGFSPLRDERLPPQADVVMFGCGHPERYAATLAENHCMIASLRSHLCAGRRIYGEGGGAAYLCRQMETPSGEFKPMTGILPAVARLVRTPGRPKPVEIRLARPTWLGPEGTQLRGYRNPNWEFLPVDGGHTPLWHETSSCEAIGSFQAIGSLVHLSLVADLGFLDSLFFPGPSSTTCFAPFAVLSPNV